MSEALVCNQCGQRSPRKSKVCVKCEAKLQYTTGQGDKSVRSPVQQQVSDSVPGRRPNSGPASPGVPDNVKVTSSGTASNIAESKANEMVGLLVTQYIDTEYKGLLTLLYITTLDDVDNLSSI